MPRVSEAHLAARRQQILDAARLCFTRNGFHATSMQDVIAEAGLSVGAVYRYFRSKDQLMAAIAEQMVGTISATLDEIAEHEPPLPLLDALKATLAAIEPQLTPDGAFQLAMQVWPESFRNQLFADLVGEIYTRMRGHFVTLAHLAVQRGELPSGTDVDAAGAALFSLIPGYGLQRVLLGEPDPATYLDGIRTIFSATIHE